MGFSGDSKLNIPFLNHITYTLTLLFFPTSRPKTIYMDESKPAISFGGLALIKRGYWYQ